MVFEVKDKVFFVTGGASGVGADIARQLAAENAKFVVMFDVNESAGISLEKELTAKHGADKVRFINGDVTNEDLFIGSIKALHKEKGLDVLVNNAGIMNDSWEKYKKQIEINVTALVTGTLHAIELMRKDKGGKGGTVVNVASVAALIQMPSLPVYFGTKSAVMQFSNIIGQEYYYSRTDVRVIAVCYGRTDTPLLDNLQNFEPGTEEEVDRVIKGIIPQTPDLAARGLIQAYKQGESGTTWLVNAGKPAENISSRVKKAFEILGEGIN